MTKTENHSALNKPEVQFKSLNIIEPILKAVKEEGYTIPTPIQSQSIPIILQGIDLLGCAPVSYTHLTLPTSDLV